MNLKEFYLKNIDNCFNSELEQFLNNRLEILYKRLSEYIEHVNKNNYKINWLTSEISFCNKVLKLRDFKLVDKDFLKYYKFNEYMISFGESIISNFKPCFEKSNGEQLFDIEKVKYENELKQIFRNEYEKRFHSL